MHLSFCGAIWVSIRPLLQILFYKPFVIAKHKLPGDPRFVPTYIHCIPNVENARGNFSKRKRVNPRDCMDFTKKI